jgi:sugar phosphate isomerase/epimerase
MPDFTLGINTCFAVKRWPEPMAWASIVRERFGVEQVQFSLDLVQLHVERKLLRQQAAEIGRACEDYGLTLHSCFTGLGAYNRNLLLAPDSRLREAALEWYRRAFEFSAVLGCSYLGGHLGALSVREFENPELRRERTERLIEMVAKLTDYGRELGLRGFLVEPMPVARELTSTLADTEQLLEALNDSAELPISLCLDLGHACAYDNEGADRDPYEWLSCFGDISPVIHLQQTDGHSDGHYPFTEQYNSRGIIEASAVLEALQASGLEETALVLEVIHAPEQREEQVLADLEESVNYWKKALEVNRSE